MTVPQLDAVPLHARDLLVRDLATVAATTTVAGALSLMRHLDVRHVPVLDATGLVGLLHEPDLLALDPDAPVGPSVHRQVPRARLQDTLEQVAALVAGSPCGAVVVLDDEEHLLGLLTDVDLRRVVSLP
ncbi:MAG: hypothetical protein JWN17_2976 [Frankiales bacterium]|nr:hypothetical protein [Frankiales bacterium]